MSEWDWAKIGSIAGIISAIGAVTAVIWAVFIWLVPNSPAGGSGTDDPTADSTAPAPPGTPTSSVPEGSSDSEVEFGEPLEVPWSLQYHGDGCGTTVNTYPSEIDFDAVVGDDDAELWDLIYEVHSACSENTRLYTSSEGHGGIVQEGTGTEPIDCRTAALAGTLPSYLRPETAEDFNLVEGSAFCLITDQDRVVRAAIEEIVVAEDETQNPIISFMSGTALIWEPTA